MQQHLLDPGRRPAKDGEFVLFPVTRDPGAAFHAGVGPYTMVKGGCGTPASRGQGTLLDIVRARVPVDLLPLVPRSFNIIGRTCIMELDGALEPYKIEIARAACTLHPAVETVYAKASAREGEFRTSALDLVLGPDEPWTVHVENGCSFRLNVKEVFFDPRLGNEHARVVESIIEMRANLDECHVLDLCCGAGPFIVPLSRVPGIVAWGVDINPVAIDLVHYNVTRNKGQQGAVTATCMDAARFLASRPAGPFDAILVNLPRDAHRFIIPACPWLGTSGRMYWYTISREIIDGKHEHGRLAAAAIDHAIEHANNNQDGDHALTNPVDDILATGMQCAREAGLQVDAVTRVKPYAPYRYIYCIELVRESST